MYRLTYPGDIDPADRSPCGGVYRYAYQITTRQFSLLSDIFKIFFDASRVVCWHYFIHTSHYFSFRPFRAGSATLTAVQIRRGSVPVRLSSAYCRYEQHFTHHI